VIFSCLLLDVLRSPQRLGALSLPEWDLLIRQARQANLLATLDALACELDLFEKIPEQAQRHLGWARTVADRHAQAVRHEVSLIRNALADTQVPVVLLKGAAYIMADLPAARGRTFSDVDILVPKSALARVEAALMMHGWATTHHDPYDQRYYRTWMHELPPMQHIKRRTVIDVHHAILPDTAPLHPDSMKLLSSAVAIEDASGLLTLDAVDMVLHSATHLFHEGELDNGLRDLVDIHRLLGHFGKRISFWPAIVKRAIELELTRPLFYALRYATAFLHTDVPPDVLKNAEAGSPNPLLLATMDTLFLRALMPVHPTCADWFTPSARRALYVRANWLRMPPHLLIPHLFHKAFLSPKDA
jgi:hypothetical protein